MRYIALLRGINISGKNKIAMSELKKLFEDNNYHNVKTYLNSGNVIFESDNLDEDNIRENAFEMIKNKFNLFIPVFIMNEKLLENVLDNSPSWWGNEDKKIYDNLIFIIPPFKYEDVFNALGSPSDGIERIEEYQNIIFWSYELKNYRKSSWWVKTASSDIRENITIRTANTMKKVLDICKGS